MQNRTATFVIPIQAMDLANKIFHAIDKDGGGERTFTPNASLTGTKPATHCVAHTYADDGYIANILKFGADAAQLKEFMDGEYLSRFSRDTVPTAIECDLFRAALASRIDKAVDAALSEMGVKIIQDETII